MTRRASTSEDAARLVTADRHLAEVQSERTATTSARSARTAPRRSQQPRTTTPVSDQLAIADRYITDTEKCLARQAALIGQLVTRNYETRRGRRQVLGDRAIPRCHARSPATPGRERTVAKLRPQQPAASPAATRLSPAGLHAPHPRRCARPAPLPRPSCPQPPGRSGTPPRSRRGPRRASPGHDEGERRKVRAPPHGAAPVLATPAGPRCVWFMAGSRHGSAAASR